MKYISKNPDFYRTLRAEVENYFKQRNLKKSGNWKLYTKASILLPLFVFLFLTPYIFELSNFWCSFFYGVLGVNCAAIGFGIAHDAVHGSFSRKTLANKVFSYAFEILGVSSYFWRYKHNLVHHTHTNVEGMDDDTETGGI